MGLPPNIHNAEQLYRAIRAYPSLWKHGQNRPSSAAFKNPKGVSVDRDGDRDLTAIIDTLEANVSRDAGLRAVVWISAKRCREIGVYPVADPKPDNAYHAEIHESEKDLLISGPKARELAKAVEIVKEYDRSSGDETGAKAAPSA